jgi:hypothetical protein
LLAGLLAGEVAAGVLLAIPAFLLGEGLRAAIALSTRSGTFVGPGIWRKCLPP